MYIRVHVCKRQTTIYMFSVYVCEYTGEPVGQTRVPLLVGRESGRPYQTHGHQISSALSLPRTEGEPLVVLCFSVGACVTDISHSSALHPSLPPSPLYCMHNTMYYALYEESTNVHVHVSCKYNTLAPNI